jgi:hypothetical protein
VGRSISRSLLFRFAVAAVLIAAAMAKLYGIVSGELSSGQLSVPPWLSVAAVLVEVLVAWSLVAYPAHAFPVGFGLVVFAIFSISAGAIWLAGSTECGCFGFFGLHPLVAIAMDIGCLVALSFSRPADFAGELRGELLRFRSQVLNRHSVVPILSMVAVGAGIPFLLGTDAGREAVALPSLSRIVATDYDVGTGLPDSWVEGSVSVNNTTDTPARIIGASASCGCIRIGDLAKVIPANETVPLSFRLNRPKSHGHFLKVITIYLEHPNQFSVHSEIEGRVM